MESVINRGIAIVLMLIFAPVALLVFGQLAVGSVNSDGSSSSFWFGINNPNTTGANCYAGGCFANGTTPGAVNLLEDVILPIMIVIGVVVVVLLGFLRFVKAL